MTDKRVVSIRQPQFLPWLGALSRIARSDAHVLLDAVQFDRSGFDHRCQVRAPAGWCWLTVPVQHPTMVPYRDLRIANDRPWQSQLRAVLGSHYRKAPHYAAYFGHYDPLFARRWESMAELAEASTRALMQDYGIATPLVRASDLQATGSNTQLLVAICREVRATTYLAGPGGRRYLDLAAFERAGIEVGWDEWAHPVYAQCHPGWYPRMSAIDALFNRGAEAAPLLKGAGT